jgi:hypothetical protein
MSKPDAGQEAEMTAPQTTSAVRVGQKWREKDKRFPGMPHREVVGIEGGKVLLKRPDGRVAKCDPRRFNGKNGGYELVEDAP